MTDTDQLPKDAKVDLKAVKVYLAEYRNKRYQFII